MHVKIIPNDTELNPINKFFYNMNFYTINNSNHLNGSKRTQNVWNRPYFTLSSNLCISFLLLEILCYMYTRKWIGVLLSLSLSLFQSVCFVSLTRNIVFYVYTKMDWGRIIGSTENSFTPYK